MGYVVYQQPSSNNHQNHRNSDTSVGQVIFAGTLAMLGVGALGCVLSAVYVAGFTFITCSLPSLMSTFQGHSVAGFSKDLFMAGLCGAIAGLIIGAKRRWIKSKNKISESFISALLTKKLFRADPMFVPSVLISVFSGLVVGCILAVGFHTPVHQVVIESFANIFGAFSSGGGGGGDAPGMTTNGWLVILVLFILIIQGTAIGIALGSFSYVFIGASIGAMKGYAKGLFRSSVEMQKDECFHSRIRVIKKNAQRGALEGGLSGGMAAGIVGLMTTEHLNKNAIESLFFWLFFGLIYIIPAAIGITTWVAKTWHNQLASSFPNIYTPIRDDVEKSRIEATFNELECPLCKSQIRLVDLKLVAEIVKCPNCNGTIFDTNNIQK